jgi:hypothetical protein
MKLAMRPNDSSFREKGLRAANDAERKSLVARWQTAHSICSLAACSMAFQGCKEGETYDLGESFHQCRNELTDNDYLEAVWQLVGLSSWGIEFLENLMKECVLFRPAGDVGQPQSDENDDLFGSGPCRRCVFVSIRRLILFTASPIFGTYLPFSTNSPTLLHLVQPYALANLHDILSHIKQFRTFLGTLTASEVNAQIARDTLIDLVDCSGVNLDLLQPLLLELMEDAKALEGAFFVHLR